MLPNLPKSAWSAMDKERVAMHAIIHGHVQGVGFRVTAIHFAEHATVAAHGQRPIPETDTETSDRQQNFTTHYL